MRLMRCTNGKEHPVTFFRDWMDNFDDHNFFGERNWSGPSVNVVESKDEVRLELALPGWKKEEIEVKVDGDLLIVKSELSKQEEADNYTYLRWEFQSGAFERRFRLGETLDTDKLEARFQDGILQLLIPHKEEHREAVRKIAIY